jgi:hypothetical protein
MPRLDVIAPEKPAEHVESSNKPLEAGPRNLSAYALLGLIATVLAVIAGVVISKKRRERNRLERQADALTSASTAREVREAVYSFAELRTGKSRLELNREEGDRGEMLRAVTSLIEYREKQPAIARELDAELRDRLIELLRELEKPTAAAPRR